MGVMSQAAFFTLQVVFWSLVIYAWVKVGRQSRQLLEGRQLLSRASLACASLTLLFTSAITIYIRVGQQKPYDRWEARYLRATAVGGLLGVVLALLGKASPRFISLFTSCFTLVIALADAVSL